MKLSVPPPPPPPPSDGTPGAGSPEEPNEQPDATASAPVEQPAAPGAPKSKPAVWPSWFSGIDVALVGLVVLFAFVAASFAARNSDLWLHLATGKRLFAGEYVPGGSDPFSYSAEGRAWVNHSWLAAPVMYLLYGGDGVVLVAAKALLVALAFGLLIAIRRPQFALWPWAAVACVGVLAAAPQFTLRPLVASMLFFAATLFLLFRVPHKKGSKQFPIATGVTFWLWASCDQWFFVGPLALALLLLGDLIQKYGFNAPDEPEGTTDADALGRLPGTAALAKALGIGLLACTLTPNHVRVWQLPFELVGAPGAASDPSMKLLLSAPYDMGLYAENPQLGYNANGLCYVLLLVLGATVVALAGSLGVGRVRVSHVALWFGFAVLSLLSVYAVPFFVLVAVPLVAAQLNAFGARAELKTWGDPRTRLLLIASSGGRVLSVLGVCILCVLAYPGWVHPDASTPALARRVAWAVEPDRGLVQAAEQLNTWRQGGDLPAEARGIITNIDLANYAAWFAPTERVLINGRLNHHRRELADYIALRRGFGLVPTENELPQQRDATDVLARHSAEYVVMSASVNPGSSAPDPRFAAQVPILVLYQQWGTWSEWYTDGRTAVFGWRPEPTGGRPSFAALHLDPALKAFGPGVKKVPDPVVQQLLVQAGWEEAFVRAPRPAPAGAVEAFGWLDYKNALLQRQVIRQNWVHPATVGWLAGQHTWHHFALRTAGALELIQIVPQYAGAETEAAAMRALPVLALRAARRAIAEDPDHPDGYYALAHALRDTDLPFSESERSLGMVVAYRQCLSRYPKADRYARGQFSARASQVAFELAQTYLGRRLPWSERGRNAIEFTGFPVDVAPFRDRLGIGQPVFQNVETKAYQRAAFNAPNAPLAPLYNGLPFLLPLDTAREALQTALEYAPIDFPNESDEQKKFAKQIETYKTAVDNLLIRYKERYETTKGLSPKLPALVISAIRNCMPSEALNLLNNKELDPESNKDGYFTALQIALELATGQIENASERLKRLSEPDNAKKLEQLPALESIQALKYQTLIIAGEYKAAGDTLEALIRNIGQLDKLKKPPGPELPLEYVQRVIVAAGLTKNPEKFPPRLLAPPLSMIPGHDQVLHAHIWLNTWDSLRVMIQRGILEHLTSESHFFTRRGVLFLLEGDVPSAKERFKESLRKPPEGWGLPSTHSPLADQYLLLIERAEKKAVKP